MSEQSGESPALEGAANAGGARREERPADAKPAPTATTGPALTAAASSSSPELAVGASSSSQRGVGPSSSSPELAVGASSSSPELAVGASSSSPELAVGASSSSPELAVGASSSSPELAVGASSSSPELAAAGEDGRSKRASITGPLPDRTPHPGAMLERWGLLGRFLSRVFFASVFFPVEAVQAVRGAASKGTVIYVLRMRNTLEFLYFNYAFLAHGLPLARFANGVRLLLWQPLGQLLRRVLGKAVRREGLETFRRLTRARRSSALFLRTPPGLIPPAEFEGPYLSSLIELQRELDRPVLLVPVTVIWGRRPVRASESQSPLRIVVDPLFGDQDEPRLFRRIWQVLRHARRSLAVVCEPLNLKEFLAARAERAQGEGQGQGGALELAQALDAELLDRIEGERRLRIGPPRAHPIEIRERILERPAVKEAIAARVASSGLRPERVRRQATRILRRMQAAMTPRGLSRLSWMVRQLWKRIFSGFEVDEAGMTRVQRVGRQGPLLFLPTHRSHIDYLIMSDLCIARSVVPPHIAAGINLSFWPLGWLFRTSGAFFLRRSFHGDDLYATLLSEYFGAVLREGHNVEIFIEGGRTRTGQVLPPKLGLLSVVADLAARGEIPPVHIVPASIGYERVVELQSLTRELGGGAKRPENISGVLKAGRKLRSNYGFVNVQFGEPIEVRGFLASRGYAGPEAAPEVRRRAIRSLGFHTNARSAGVTAVTPTALCAAALLVPGTRGVRRDRLLSTVELLGRAARAAGARFSMSLWRDGHPMGEASIDYALELLARDRAVSSTGQGAETVYVVERDARLRLEYYKNQVMAHLLDAALLAMVLRARQAREGELIAHASIERTLDFLIRMLRPQFVHQAGGSLAGVRAAGIERLRALGLIRVVDEGVRLEPESHAPLALLAAPLESSVEGQAACARALEVLRGGSMLRRTLEQEVLERVHRWYLTGEVRRYESCQVGMISATIDWLCREGVLQQQGDGAAREVRLAWQHGDGATLSELAERVEELLPRRAAA